MKHRTRLATSRRLQRVMCALQSAGQRGITTYALMASARVTDVKDTIYELRCQGVAIADEWVKVGESRVKSYRLTPPVV